MKLFKSGFEVVEIHKSGAVVKHSLKGSRKSINKDIKTFQKISEDYEMVGKSGMVVWR